MDIHNHLISLLYAHDCVVLPGFGGFILDRAPAEIDAGGGTAYPPSRRIAFNALLRRNDGLLASYVASAEGIGYEDAFRRVSSYAAACRSSLDENKRLALDDVGLFYLDRSGNVHFNPDRRRNFLAESYGLAPVALKPLRAAAPLPAAPAESKRPEGNRTASALRPLEWLPIAALLVLMLMVPALVPTFHGMVSSLGPDAPTEFANLAEPAKPPGDADALGPFAGLPAPDERVAEAAAADSSAVAASPAETAAADSTAMAEDATGVAAAATPQPGAEAAVPEPAAGPFFVIAGCFSVHENAARFVDELRGRGFPAAEAGVNAAGLTMVSAASHATLPEAETALAQVREQVIPSAWIFRKRN
jgi:hypothetical protein